MCAARLFMSKQKKKKQEEERKRLAKLENNFENGISDFDNTSIPNYVSLPPEGHLKFHGWTMLMKEINKKIHLNHMKQAWIESNEEALVNDDVDTHYDSVEIIEIHKGDKGRRGSEKESIKDPKSRGGKRNDVCKLRYRIYYKSSHGF